MALGTGHRQAVPLVDLVAEEVSAMVDEEGDKRGVAHETRNHEGCETVSVLEVDAGSSENQELGHVEMAIEASRVERSEAA